MLCPNIGEVGCLPHSLAEFPDNAAIQQSTGHVLVMLNITRDVTSADLHLDSSSVVLVTVERCRHHIYKR